MTDIADEQQAAARQREAAAIGRSISAIGIERAGHLPPALLERLGQVALHQPQPVGIGGNLVRRIDRRDRILQVADGGQRGFQDDVGYAGRVGRADRVVRVEDDFDMQAIMAEQPALRTRADKLRRIGQDDFLARQIGPASRCQRNGIVQKRLGPGDDLRPARRVIALARSRARNGIRAIERIIQAAPARIGGVEQETGVEDRDNQLRPGHAGDFGIDILAADPERRRFLDQIADLAQEGLIGSGVVRLPPAHLMPRVDLRLQVIARAQQRRIVGGEARQYVGSARPEGGGINARARQRALLDEIGQRLRNLQAGAFNHTVGHAIHSLLCRPFTPFQLCRVDAIIRIETFLW